MTSEVRKHVNKNMKILVKYVKIEIFLDKTVFAFDRILL